MMKDAGVYHVLAISGLHIAVFCHLILALTRVLPLRRRLRNSLALLCLWCRCCSPEATMQCSGRQ